jgi:imidazolonepropionase-like amidohydrolase
MTKLPDGAVQIDGRDKYLMPGLADMHVHLYPGAGQPDDLTSQQLQLFLANGVTTMKTPRDFGTVEIGLRADLILLDANPLESVANLSKRAGVMVRGRWLPQSELSRMLENIATLNAQNATANATKIDASGTRLQIKEAN